MALNQVGFVDLKKDADGKQYLEGYLQVREKGRRNRVLIVPNPDKRTPEDPDFIIYRERHRIPKAGPDPERPA